MLLPKTGLVLTALAQATHASLAEKCSSLPSSLAIENVTINFAEFVPVGTNLLFSQDYNLETCLFPSQIIYNDLCRVAMRVATSTQSEITLEAWLPINWNGRFLSTGNGGVSGCIQYVDLAYTASLGFATVGANNGHNGTSGKAFYMNPDIVADFAYRSLHMGVVVGKAVTRAYYGKAHNTSYYLGCSTGGRQGLKSVEDFPEDFDGVIAGAPANAFNNLTSWGGNFLTILGTPTSPTFVPLAMWPRIHQEVLNQCDGLDGILDGIIEDPTMCHFRPETLRCTQSFNSNCLTDLQVNSVQKIYSPYFGADGALIYPAMQTGSELVAQLIYYSGKPFAYTTDWFKYAIYNNASWDPYAFTVQDAAFAASKNPSDIQTWKGDLSAFQSRGGKLLQFHGQQDPVITSNNSPRYYNHVSKTMGLPPKCLDDFYRLFRISGMGHCVKGPGAWQIGQSINTATDDPQTPQNNIVLAMMAWVEEAIPPETVTGSKYIDDNPAHGLNFTRNHCRYPYRNTLLDSARYKEASAWKCIPMSDMTSWSWICSWFGWIGPRSWYKCPKRIHWMPKAKPLY